MPQMSPYNWVMLFLYFNMILFFIISNNHFMLPPQLNYSIQLKMKFNYFWKW